MRLYYNLRIALHTINLLHGYRLTGSSSSRGGRKGETLEQSVPTYTPRGEGTYLGNVVKRPPYYLALYTPFTRTTENGMDGILLFMPHHDDCYAGEY